MSNLVLTVGGSPGEKYSGWQTVRVSRMLEAIAGSFALKVSDRWGTQTAPWPIQPEAECTITIDDQPVLAGAVDRRGQTFDAASHELSVEGRDVCGMLVDCSVDVATVGSDFAKLGVLELCQRICQPYGIQVYLQDGLADTAISTGSAGKKPTSARPTSVGSAGKTNAATIGRPYDNFAIHQGESPFNVIDEACRIVGILPVSNGQGDLILTRAGGSMVCGTALIEGKNILAAGVSYDASKRYYRYTVVSQTPSTDEQNGPAAAAVQSHDAIDQGVRRQNRHLIIAADKPMTQEFATARAQWEMTVRNARASQISARVQGWTQRDGTLWPLNALVPFTSPKLGIDDQLLIIGLEFSKSDDEGTTTGLTLARPDAFAPEALITSKGSPGWGMKGTVAQVPL